MDHIEAAPITISTWYMCSLCEQEVYGPDDDVPCYDGKPGHDTERIEIETDDASPCWCNAYSRDEDGLLPETNLEHPMGCEGCAYADPSVYADAAGIAKS